MDRLCSFFTWQGGSRKRRTALTAWKTYIHCIVKSMWTPGYHSRKLCLHPISIPRVLMWSWTVCLCLEQPGDRKGFLQDSGMSVEILRSALVRSCTGEGQEGLAYNQCSRSSQRDSVWLKSGLCEGDLTTNSSNPKHAAIGKILPQTVATKLKAYNWLQSL